MARNTDLPANMMSIVPQSERKSSVNPKKFI